MQLSCHSKLILTTGWRWKRSICSATCMNDKRWSTIKNEHTHRMAHEEERERVRESKIGKIRRIGREKKFGEMKQPSRNESNVNKYILHGGEQRWIHSCRSVAVVLQQTFCIGKTFRFFRTIYTRKVSRQNLVLVGAIFFIIHSYHFGHLH